jgi:hypothetical protein
MVSKAIAVRAHATEWAPFVVAGDVSLDDLYTVIKWEEERAAMPPPPWTITIPPTIEDAGVQITELYAQQVRMRDAMGAWARLREARGWDDPAKRYTELERRVADQLDPPHIHDDDDTDEGSAS